MSKKITVCGVVYTVIQATEQTYSELANSFGYCDYKTKCIVIRQTQDILQKRSVLCHEVMHAFFNECGLECYSQDEILVTFLEYQLPKIIKLCKKINTL